MEYWKCSVLGTHRIGLGMKIFCYTLTILLFSVLLGCLFTEESSSGDQIYHIYFTNPDSLIIDNINVYLVADGEVDTLSFPHDSIIFEKEVDGQAIYSLTFIPELSEGTIFTIHYEMVASGFTIIRHENFFSNESPKPESKVIKNQQLVDFVKNYQKLTRNAESFDRSYLDSLFVSSLLTSPDSSRSLFLESYKSTTYYQDDSVVFYQTVETEVASGSYPGVSLADLGITDEFINSLPSSSSISSSQDPQSSMLSSSLPTSSDKLSSDQNSSGVEYSSNFSSDVNSSGNNSSTQSSSANPSSGGSSSEPSSSSISSSGGSSGINSSSISSSSESSSSESSSSISSSSSVPMGTLYVSCLPVGCPSYGTVSFAQKVMPVGGITSVTATPNDGYVFSYWSDAAIGTVNIFNPNQATTDVTLITASGQLRATFAEKEYTITVAPVSNGHVEINSARVSAFSIKHNSVKSVTAVPNAGYHFVEWQTNTPNISFSQSATTFLQATSDGILTPVFAGDQRTIYIKVDSMFNTITCPGAATATNNTNCGWKSGKILIGGTDYTNTPTYNYVNGTSVSIQAIADFGNEFNNWIPSSGMTLSNTANATTNLTAASAGDTLRVKFDTLTVGTVTDTRDAKIYPWKRIGSQIWFTKNLNYDDIGNIDRCYADDLANCETYGRLYVQNSADDVCKGMEVNWDLPTDEQWKTLEMYAGMAPADTGVIGWVRGETNQVGYKLMSTTGWSTNNGTDDFGFGAIGGGHFNGTNFSYLGQISFFWSLTMVDDKAYYRNFSYGKTGVFRSLLKLDDAMSVRCVYNFESAN